MLRQGKKIKLNPEAAAKKRIEIIAALKKVNMRIIPQNFEIEVFGDTEYPKMVQVDNDGRIDTLRIFSREEEDALTNKWVDPDTIEKPKRGRKTVTNGDREDGPAGD